MLNDLFHSRWRATHLDLCFARMAFSSEGYNTCQCRDTGFPLFSPLNVEHLAKEQSLVHYLYCLGLDLAGILTNDLLLIRRELYRLFLLQVHVYLTVQIRVKTVKI
jgi:hypothetical protein